MCWACAVFTRGNLRWLLWEKEQVVKIKRMNTSNNPRIIAGEIQQQLGDLIKMVKDQKEKVSKLNRELSGDCSVDTKPCQRKQ